MNKKYILLLAVINLILQVYAYQNNNLEGISYLFYPYLAIFLFTVYLCFLKSTRKYAILTLVLLILIDLIPPLYNANVFTSHKVLRGDTLKKIN